MHILVEQIVISLISNATSVGLPFMSHSLAAFILSLRGVKPLFMEGVLSFYKAEKQFSFPSNEHIFSDAS